jgi:hypothetical protein
MHIKKFGQNPVGEKFWVTSPGEEFWGDLPGGEILGKPFVRRKNGGVRAWTHLLYLYRRADRRFTWFFVFRVTPFPGMLRLSSPTPPLCTNCAVDRGKQGRTAYKTPGGQ